MKQEQQQLSDAQVAAETLKSIKPHPLYKPVDGIPIPAQMGILVKHLPKSNIIETTIKLGNDSTDHLLLASGNNTQNTCEGIIMSVGPKCSPDVRKGLKIQYATNVHDIAPRFNHKGKEYLGMDEYSILFYMVDESTTVDLGVKSPKQVRREKKIPEQQGIINRLHNRDMNEKDKEKDKMKGKIKPVSNKL